MRTRVLNRAAADRCRRRVSRRDCDANAYQHGYQYLRGSKQGSRAAPDAVHISLFDLPSAACVPVPVGIRVCRD